MKATDTAVPPTRCGIVLSAGNGLRMRDFVYRRRADYLPKQYLNFIGRRSLLEHTLDRSEKLISSDKLFVIIAKEHLQFEDARRQIDARPQECIVIQPENKDTGPGILLPLMLVHHRHPDALVAIFPSDHFILEEDLFVQYVERAFTIVESNDSSILLLGIEPTEADPEYGYIVPAESIESMDADGARVELFVEKPSSQRAKIIIRNGGLWNTLVVVAKCKTLLEAFQRAAPELCHSFEDIQDAIGTPQSQRIIEQVYRTLPSLNFSRSILENLSFHDRKSLRVLPIRGVSWSDWGSTERLTSTLRQLGAPDFTMPEPLSLAKRGLIFEQGAAKKALS